jgi:hypothetical protein
MERMKRKIYAKRSHEYKINEKAINLLRSCSHPQIFQEIQRICNKEFQEQGRISATAHNAKLTRLLVTQSNKNKVLTTNKNSLTATNSVPTLETNRFVNLSATVLSQQEAELLSKGPKFIPSTVINGQSILGLKVGFQKLINQIRWKMDDTVFRNGDTFLKCPAFKEVMTPQLRPEVEKVLGQVGAKFQTIIQRIKISKPPKNLSSQQLTALKSLKHKAVTILPSDKGGNFCIADKSLYDETVLKHLQSPEYYRRLSYVDPKKIEEKINNTWKNICNRRRIPKHIMNHYVTTCSSIPTFKGLVKTHKQEADLKIRPLVNCTDGPCYKLSWLLQRILQKYSMESTTSATSCDNVLQELRGLDSNILLNFTYPYSLDVKDMYTSIPPDEAINLLHQRLCFDNFNYYGLIAVDITELLTAILTSNYFRFNNLYFKQISGLPMGNKLSGLLANVFMEDLETPLIKELSIPFYKRYVDDCLVLAKDENEAVEVARCFNMAHNKIKFEIEKPLPHDLSLSLLDFTIQIKDGSTSFQPYTKIARSDIMFNGGTALPKSMKDNIIRNEWTRINSRCMNSQQSLFYKKQYINRLKKNEHALIPKLNNRPKRSYTQPEEPVYLSIPFISDECNTRIKKALKPIGMNVRIVHKGKQLRHILHPPSNKLPTRSGSCELSNCNLNNHLCYRKLVVYKCLCLQCDQFYIGSTKKFLHIRIKEHNNKASSVYQHNVTCNKGRGWSYSIMRQCNSIPDMRFAEAQLISDLQPTINKKEELFSLSKIYVI